jgi:rare lipoprotein A
MLIVPVIALSGGGPRTATGKVRVAAGAPVAAASSVTPAPAATDLAVTDTAITQVPAPAAASPAMPNVQAATVASAAPATAPAATPAPTAAPRARVASVPLQRTTTVPPTTAPPTTQAPAAAPASSRSESGGASWYGAPAGTCAHQTLPFGTVVHIYDTATGKSATCTVEDRGPYVDGRIIDLAPDVFQQLAPTSSGVTPVQISW